MPSSYTESLRLVKPVTGELDGSWGDTINAGLTELVEDAIAGTVSIAMGDANVTLSAANETADQARNMFITLTGALSAGRNVVCPSVSKMYVVTNSTTGGFPVTFKTGAGAGVAVDAGTSAILYCNGADVVGADTAAVASAAAAAAIDATNKDAVVLINAYTSDALIKERLPAAGSLTAGEVFTATTNFTLNAALAAGNVYPIYNNSASTIVITQGSGVTLRLAGSTSTGNRTLAARGMASVWCLSTSEYIISGAGVL